MSCFGNYELSLSTLEKLKEANELLKNEDPTDSDWYIIKPKEKHKDVNDGSREIVTFKVEGPQISDNETETPPPMTSTQFFFSQVERKVDDTTNNIDVKASYRWVDIAELLYESLEKSNDALCLLHLKTLSDDELNNVIQYLSEKLSLTGTYNLCNSLCASDVENSLNYIRIICSNLLLQKIINLKEPSRLISSLINELLQKFPDDVREFIFVPMLKLDLQETSAILAIVSGFPIERKSNLIENFLTFVDDLKEWHNAILASLINRKLSDDVAKNKLLYLLFEKASTYARDKNYSKFILSFIKLNSPFTEDQKRSLMEIVAVNETIFKRAMENLLKNMYIYGDLWHMT